MKSIEKQWIAMKIYEKQRKVMKINESNWNSMKHILRTNEQYYKWIKIIKNQNHKETHENNWRVTKIYENKWKQIKINWF